MLSLSMAVVIESVILNVIDLAIQAWGLFGLLSVHIKNKIEHLSNHTTSIYNLLLFQFKIYTHILSKF